MSSLYLARLTPQQRGEAIPQQHEAQRWSCFIREDPIDLPLPADGVDIHHVIPLKAGGRGDPDNSALASVSCNRSKRASVLRVAKGSGEIQPNPEKVRQR
jgi:hypothetical protein